MLEFTFADDTYGVVHRASPARDIAYFCPQLLLDVEKRLRNTSIEELKKNQINSEEELLDAYLAFCKFFVNSLDPEIKTVLDCIKSTGFLDLSESVQTFILSAFAKSILGGVWVGLRSSVFEGETPPSIKLMQRNAERLHQEWFGKKNSMSVLTRVFGGLEKLAGPLPTSYLVLDVETSGLEPDKDFILQIGHCLVKKGVVIDRNSFLFNWALTLSENKIRWLKHRVENTEKAIREMNKEFHTTWAHMLACGVNPSSILRGYLMWLEDIVKTDFPLVMHNGYRFDVPFFYNIKNRIETKVDINLSDNLLYDTGAILKAAQLQLYPRVGDSLASYFKYIVDLKRRGVRWSLNEYAVPLFKLKEKHKLSVELAHDAGYDCYVTHLLLEEMRQLALTGKPLPINEINEINKIYVGVKK